MRTTRHLSVLALVASFVLVLAACHVGAVEREDATYYAIEINGKLCGYSTLRAASTTIDDREMTVVDHEVFAMVSLLGSRFNTEISSRFVIDPATERIVEATSEIRQGPSTTSFSARIEGNTAYVQSSLSPADKTVELSPDVLIEDPMFMHHLRHDFIGTDTQEKTYDTFQLIEGEVQPVRYTRVGSESLELSGRTYDSLIVDAENLKTAVKMRIWVDGTDARPLKLDLPSGRDIYLSDAAVKKKIEVVNLDETITAKVDVSIADIQSISYMKVRAKIDPIGLQVTPESLNVPGQKFTGTVVDNLVEGVFEIEHLAYDGTDAPPFPPSFEEDETLQPFLEPGMLINASDPVLVAAAREITAGSKDSWEAVQRLSEWVAEEIDYAIPGGGTARRTYDMRAGECGSHSNLLAAFSRAVGIPARVVWGCMYVPNFGGAFGQHGWNEVYMGPRVGWVPLDATAFETAHVDSGHIRIGVHETLSTALNPIELEVLDHRLGGTTSASTAEMTARYERFTGMYTNVEAQRGIELRVQDGSLVVDIPEQVVLPLDDPDEDGKWPCKLTKRVFVTFEADDDAKASSMKLHELVRMRRTSSPETIDEDVPEELRPYLGKYMLAALNAEFTVLYEDGGLAVHDPLKDDTVQLQSPDADGGWLDEYDKNTIYFEKDETGNVTELTVDSVATFRRS
jgi:transglutaminase-like putative cysteine protease